MANVTHMSPLVTEQKLTEFYSNIKPYLGGSVSTGFTPVGTVISIMSNHAPAGYLICNGQTVNIVDYKELANHFETEFGSKNYFGGDGTTTFAVPDLRGEFLRGSGTNGHANQGSGLAVGAHQDGTEHPYMGINTSSTYTPWTLTDGHTRTQSGIAPYQIDSAIAGEGKTGTTALAGSNNLMKQGTWSSTDTTANYTSRPTNTSVLYCIATHNMFMNEGSNYSTDEQIVGTWIDGKPIYQRTFSAITLIKNTTNLTQIGSDLSANINLVIDSYICAIGTNGWQASGSAPWTYATVSTSEKVRVEVWRSDSNTLQVYGFNNDNIDYTLSVTVLYTKTTD